MVCCSSTTNSSLTISGKRQDSSSLMPSPTTWHGIHKVCRCFLLSDRFTVCRIKLIHTTSSLSYSPPLFVANNAHYVRVTACIWLHKLPSSLWDKRCVTRLCVRRKPYPSSDRAAPAVGSAADRYPHRGGGWADD